MGENKVLNETTVIQFNLKWFIGSLISLLISLGGFYFTIVKPDNDSIKNVVEQRFTDNEKFQNLKFEKLDEMNQKLGDLELKIDALNRRNTDLNELRTNNNNTSASF
jgi:hypothetical protein